MGQASSAQWYNVIFRQTIITLYITLYLDEVRGGGDADGEGARQQAGRDLKGGGGGGEGGGKKQFTLI